MHFQLHLNPMDVYNKFHNSTFIIVGGGTAGLISALMLKKFSPKINITIIKSSQIGIIGVGEGSTEHLQDFIEYTEIDFKELIANTGATIKMGIQFKDWAYLGNEYPHSIFSPPIISEKGNLEIYNNIVINESQNPYCLSEGFTQYYLNNNLGYADLDKPISNQYHFDTFKLNEFLLKKCKEREINILETKVQDIKLDSQGNISQLVTDTGLVNGDFFIDASGFNKVLSSKLGSKWVSYQDYLPMNRSITLATPLNLKKGIEPYTLTKALKSGWRWKIPTQTRYGNGYVFCDEFTTPEEALIEFNKDLNTNFEEYIKDIKFEAGRLDKFWVKNCVNIGLSSGFIEPLEAQSISFSIIQTKALIDHLNKWNYNKNISTIYNKLLVDSFDNIVDFVQSHYFSQRTDSDFWKSDILKYTLFNKEYKTLFSKGNFTSVDFDSNPYYLFSKSNFYQIYFGLGLITPQNLLSQRLENLESYNDYWYIEYKKSKIPILNSIPHIEYLNLIKENHSL